jgi:hypothetical protein
LDDIWTSKAVENTEFVSVGVLLMTVVAVCCWKLLAKRQWMKKQQQHCQWFSLFPCLAAAADRQMMFSTMFCCRRWPSWWRF